MRGDLEKIPTYFGATDVKVINFDLASKGALLAQFGLAHDNVPPFEWPSSVYSSLSGLPKSYDFQW